MTDSTPENKPRGRNPIRLALGGCAVLLIVLLCALVVNAVYWTNRMGVFAQAPDPAEISSITSESLPPGNAADGEALFRGDAACFACHSLEQGEKGVGPSLAGAGSRAATVQPGVAAEAYLLESIVSPDAYVVEGFQGGIMPPNFGQRLSPQQLADLVAFLMTSE